MGKIRPIMVKGHTRALTMIKYNKQGDLLFSCAKDHVPSLWYAENGERIGTYNGHCGTVWAIDVNEQSTHLLTGAADNFCKLWDVKTGECLHTWKHTAPVRCVNFALGDKHFLSVLDNIMGNVPTIFVWDLDLNSLDDHPDCPERTMLGHTGKIGRALWGPLNERIFSVSEDTTLRTWDPKTGEQDACVEGVHSRKITDLQFSLDKLLFVTSCTDMHVRLFETKTLTVLHEFNSERPLNSAAISPLPHCPYFIAGGGQDAMSVTTTAAQQGKFETIFFDYAFGDELGCIAGHFGPVNTLAFNPDGRTYASGGEDGYIRIHHLDADYFSSHSQKVDVAYGKEPH